MTNMFTERAAIAGRTFVQDFPRTTGVQIDEASPKFNPARRAFQNAANWLQKEIQELGPVFYRWEIMTTDLERYVGFAATTEEAKNETKVTIKLLMQDGKKIAHHTIENQDGVVIIGVFNRRP